MAPPKRRSGRLDNESVRLNDSDSITEYFKPTTPPSARKLRLTEHQKEVLSAKKDRLDFMQEDSQQSGSNSHAVLKKRLPQGYKLDSQTEDSLQMEVENLDSQLAVVGSADPPNGKVKQLEAEEKKPMKESTNEKIDGPTDFSVLLPATNDTEDRPRRSQSASPHRSKQLNKPSSQPSSQSRHSMRTRRSPPDDEVQLIEDGNDNSNESSGSSTKNDKTKKSPSPSRRHNRKTSPHRNRDVDNRKWEAQGKQETEKKTPERILVHRKRKIQQAEDSGSAKKALVLPSKPEASAASLEKAALIRQLIESTRVRKSSPAHEPAKRPQPNQKSPGKHRNFTLKSPGKQQKLTEWPSDMRVRVEREERERVEKEKKLKAEKLAEEEKKMQAEKQKQSEDLTNKREPGTPKKADAPSSDKPEVAASGLIAKPIVHPTVSKDSVKSADEQTTPDLASTTKEQPAPATSEAASEPAQKPKETTDAPNAAKDSQNDSVIIDEVMEIPQTPPPAHCNPVTPACTPQSILRRQETPRSARSADRRVTFDVQSAERAKRPNRTPAVDCIAPELVKCTESITSLCMKLAPKKQGIRLDNVLKRQRIWTIGDFAGLSEDEVAGLAFVKEPKLENVRQVLRGYKPPSPLTASERRESVLIAAAEESSDFDDSRNATATSDSAKDVAPDSTPVKMSPLIRNGALAPNNNSMNASGDQSVVTPEGQANVSTVSTHSTIPETPKSGSIRGRLNTPRPSRTSLALLSSMEEDDFNDDSHLIGFEIPGCAPPAKSPPSSTTTDDNIGKVMEVLQKVAAEVQAIGGQLKTAQAPQESNNDQQKLAQLLELQNGQVKHIQEELSRLSAAFASQTGKKKETDMNKLNAVEVVEHLHKCYLIQNPRPARQHNGQLSVALLSFVSDLQKDMMA